MHSSLGYRQANQMASYPLPCSYYLDGSVHEKKASQFASFTNHIQINQYQSSGDLGKQGCEGYGNHSFPFPEDTNFRFVSLGKGCSSVDSDIYNDISETATEDVISDISKWEYSNDRLVPRQILPIPEQLYHSHGQLLSNPVQLLPSSDQLLHSTELPNHGQLLSNPVQLLPSSDQLLHSTELPNHGQLLSNPVQLLQSSDQLLYSAELPNHGQLLSNPVQLLPSSDQLLHSTELPNHGQLRSNPVQLLPSSDQLLHSTELPNHGQLLSNPVQLLPSSDQLLHSTELPNHGQLLSNSVQLLPDSEQVLQNCGRVLHKGKVNCESVLLESESFISNKAQNKQLHIEGVCKMDGLGGSSDSFSDTCIALSDHINTCNVDINCSSLGRGNNSGKKGLYRKINNNKTNVHDNKDNNNSPNIANSSTNISRYSITKSVKVNRNISFRNSPRQYYSKSKEPCTVLLPPCRICGARASGFHYGVNSCEACKGFFRRAMKRPTVFYCAQNKKCDIKGNRRSTCRFCRYKKCLRLGMSKESIKTGRYSHMKRTSDTIEVKKLQSSAKTVEDNSELDNIIINIISAHDSHIMSTTNVPKDLIYRKQLEYHNMFVLHKKFGDFPGVSMNNCTDPSMLFGHDSKFASSNDGVSDLSEFVKSMTSSRSSSQLSSDSGFVDEHETITDGNKAGVSHNELHHNYEVFPDSIPESRDRTFEGTSAGYNMIYKNRYDTSKDIHKRKYVHLSAEQNSTIEQTIILRDFKNECSSQKEFILPSNKDFLTNQFSRDTRHCIYDSSSLEEEIKRKKYRITSKSEDGINDVILETYTNSVHDFSGLGSRNYDSPESKQSSMEDLCCLNSIERCSRPSICALFDVSFTKDEKAFCRTVEDFETKHTLDASDVTQNMCSATNMFKENDISVYPGSNASKSTIPFNNTKERPDESSDQEATIEYIHTLTAVTESRKRRCLEKCNDSVDVRRESQDEIMQRAKEWISGYVDFAKTIPGFASLPSQDQTVLLQHAWDEVWILGTFRGYSSDLGVVVGLSGRCFHAEEMEAAWGKNYSRIAFNVAEIINRQNFSSGLISLLKAVCIVTPDRCSLTNINRVEEIHWMMVSCVLRHLEITQPRDHMIFPRIVSILTSLRELSELARRDLESESVDCVSRSNILTEPASFFW